MLREVHAVELPYPTTCYTGARTPFRFDCEATDDSNSGVDPNPQSTASSETPEGGGFGGAGRGEAERISGEDEGSTSVVRSENRRGAGVAAAAGGAVVVARLAAERNSVEFAFYRPPPPPPSTGRRRRGLLSAEGEFRTTVRRLPRVATASAGRRAKGGVGSPATAKRREEWVCVAHDCCVVQRRHHVEVFAIRRPPTQQRQTTSGAGGSSSERNQLHREGGGGRAAPSQREDDGSSVTAASTTSSVSAAVQKPPSSGASAPVSATTAASAPPDGRNHGSAASTSAEATAAPHDGKSTKFHHDPSTSAASASSAAATSSSAVTPTRRNSGQSSAVVDQTATTTNDRKGVGGGGATATGNASSDASNRPPPRNGTTGDGGGGGGDEGSMPAEAYLVLRRLGGASPPTPTSPPDEVDDREEGKGDRQRASGGGGGGDVGGDGSKRRRSRHGAVDQIIPVPFQPLVVRLTRFFHGGRGHSDGVSSSSSSSVAGLIVGSSDAVAPLRIYLPIGAMGCFEECTIVDGGRKRSRGGSIDDGGGDPDRDRDRGEGGDEQGDFFGEEDRRSFLPPTPPSPQSSSSSQGSSDQRQHPATGSPVMALDACHDVDDGVHYLAVGYQNGCVRVVAYRLTDNGASAAAAPSKSAVATPPSTREPPASKSSPTPSSPVFAPTVLRACTFLVDGPVVSLCLRLVRRRRWRPGRSTTKNTRTSSVHLIAGSLCGFACSFVREVPPPVVPRDESSGDVGLGGDGDDADVEDYDQSSFYSFRGPFVVTEGLRWRSSGLEGEDGVLAVSEFAFGATRSGTCVAVGTHSGRVLLFEPVGGGGDDCEGCGGRERVGHERLDTSAAADDGEDCDDAGKGVADVGGNPDGGGRGRRRPTPIKNHHRYRLFWTTRLPYPIHGIASADLDGDGLPELLVTTRKSLHVFRMDVTHLANMVKLRFEDILRVR